MTVRSTFSRLAALAALAGLAATSPALAQQTMAPSQMASPKILIARIDTNCLVFHDAIKSQTPTEVALRGTSTWKLVAVGDMAAVEKTPKSVTFAKVWKQAKNYVWAHWVTRDVKGNAHATQLCFRTDGTLARVRQATTVAALDAAAASQAYYNTDGSLIRKSQLFSVDDPAIYKAVSKLPFFTILP